MTNAIQERDDKGDTCAVAQGPASAPVPPRGAPPSPPRPRPTIAVLAVHGVADQQPFDTARQVADLLLGSHAAAPTAPYTTAHERMLRVRVVPVVVPPRVSKEAAPGGNSSGAAREGGWSFHEIAQESQNIYKRERVTVTRDADDADDAGSVDHIFARRVLGGDDDDKGTAAARAAEAVYETVRVETARLVDGAPTCDVHVYELYWADLSRLGRGALHVFGELFQILFHLPSLGRHTIDAALLDNAPSDRWKSYSTITSWAVHVLTVGVAVLNILLIGVAIMVVISGVAGTKPRRMTAENWNLVHAVVVWGVLGVGVVMVAGWFAARRVWKHYVPLAAALLIIPGCMLIGWAVEERLPGLYLAERLAGLLAMGAGIVVARVLVCAYAERRPEWTRGLASLAGGALIGVAAWITLSVPHDPRGSVGLLAGAYCFELVMDVLWILWPVFVVLLWGTLAAGWLAVRETTKRAAAAAAADAAARVDRARRAAFTAILVLTLSAGAFTVVALPLWAAAWVVVKRIVPGDRPYEVWVKLLHHENHAHTTIGEFLGGLTRGTTSFAFSISAAALLVSLVMAAWGLGPIAIAEARPPKDAKDAKDASDRNYEGRAMGQGHWLTGGYQLLRWATWVAFVGIAVVYPVGLCLMLFPFPARFTAPLRGEGVNNTLLAAATVLVATAGGLLAFRARLNNLALGFRPIVDLMFDVDNHLREHPHGRNPRARIAARYVSLLRYVAQWRQSGPGSDGYRELIIVAHSQGTVITADLLRFLMKEREGTAERDPELLPILDGALPLQLFTMGCPLRQLYSLRFPYLYRWARNTDPRGADYADPIPPMALPEPAKLGVRRWVNAFRAGDYVGRWLWRADLCAYMYGSRESEDALGTRKDRCIGAGAHTHYWDETAPLIAAELDEIIARACPDDGASNRAPAHR